ncbi:hypothetical protein TRFO_25687 [Tritrichomonas foetus]|uniref:Uncharacterized protein n=1 Tax=Tritrichomonas foetus TaxID=1144522 RepID=A0A1J4K5X7_9EUKA|nr:hypothetical protein TRFO_25687 [Tritrichomonas foetus]|eukprot:OHT06280.1 hypothetical protein TRFO_25687 [Tritrichomonas foetus]
MSGEYELSSANMQMAIITALENANATCPDNQSFVPQSILWQRIAEPEGGPVLEGDEKERMYRCFLAALVGKKNSVALFESIEDPETSEIRWRLRPQTPESAAMYLSKGDKPLVRQEEPPQQIEELQKTLVSLRRQANKLESDNHQYAMIIDRIKRTASPEVRKNFEFFESLYSFIEQFDHSMSDIEKHVKAIGKKIDKLEIDI